MIEGFAIAQAGDGHNCPGPALARLRAIDGLPPILLLAVAFLAGGGCDSRCQTRRHKVLRTSEISLYAQPCLLYFPCEGLVAPRFRGSNAEKMQKLCGFLLISVQKSLNFTA
jgi:hypothetical protein